MTKQRVHQAHTIPTPRPGGEQVIEPSEYLRLALSMHKLVRADEPQSNLLVLLDPETGSRFVVDRSEVLSQTIGNRKQQIETLSS